MRAAVFFRIVVVSLSLASPSLAEGHEIGIGYPGEIALVDSISRRQPPKDDKKPDDKKPGDRRPDIKEVPRSKRLPKPTAVIDRIRNKRPPIKLPRPVGGGRGRGH